MIQVLVEVRIGTTRLRVAVRAESIRRAVVLVGSRYPGCVASVSFPLDPETFFVEGSGSAAGLVELEAMESVAV